MLIRKYFVFMFFYIGYCHAIWDDTWDKCSVPYSVLLSIDSNLTVKLGRSDSLIDVVLEESKKLHRNVCQGNYCIDSCHTASIPQSLAYEIPLGRWLKLVESAKSINTAINPRRDTLYEPRRCPDNEIIIDPPMYIINACSLHFSSKILPNGKQIILINGSSYSIVKKDDGTSVLRKMD